MSSFAEVQHYSWLLNTTIVVAIVGTLAFLWNRVASRKYLLILATPFALLLVYFMSQQLATRIDAQGIHYKMFPEQMNERDILWSDISSVYVRDYIVYSRISQRYDVYTINDRYGLFIILKNGKRIILGTKKPDEMKRVLFYNGY